MTILDGCIPEGIKKQDRNAVSVLSLFFCVCVMAMESCYSGMYIDVMFAG